jgi:hypothetical protein
LIPRGFQAHFPLRPKKTSSSLLHTDRDTTEQSPCNWSFTNWNGDGNTCEFAIRNGSGGC